MLSPKKNEHAFTRQSVSESNIVESRIENIVKLKIHEAPAPSVYQILKAPRFIGLFITQFLTAFNDNFYKNAIVALLTFGLISDHYSDATRQGLVILAGAAFVLPYFLFSATAGKLADKIDRITIVRAVKRFEIFLMIVGAFGFIFQNIYILFVALFLMGTHSAIFSPVKFGILPLYLHKNALIGGNALIESATFAAIILGTAAGTQFILIDGYGAYISSALMILTAIVGYYTGLKMPRIRASEPDMAFNWNVFSHMAEVFSILKREKTVLTYIVAASWFWGVAAVFVTLFPLFVKDVLRSDHNVYTLILIVFSVGVGVGSVACAKLLSGKISAKYTPIASVIMGLCAIDAGIAARPLADPGELYGIAQFLSSVVGWRIIGDFFLIACAGGLYVVPFFSLIQETAEKHVKSRVIAGNNIINAAFMVVGALSMYFAGKAGMGLKEVLIVTGVMCLAGAFAIHYVTPDSVFRRKPR